MATYWTQVDGKYYFLGADGSMRTYWQNIYGKYYWLGRDGAMKTGLAAGFMANGTILEKKMMVR